MSEETIKAPGGTVTLPKDFNGKTFKILNVGEGPLIIQLSQDYHEIEKKLAKVSELLRLAIMGLELCGEYHKGRIREIRAELERIGER